MFGKDELSWMMDDGLGGFRGSQRRCCAAPRALESLCDERKGGDQAPRVNGLANDMDGLGWAAATRDRHLILVS